MQLKPNSIASLIMELMADGIPRDYHEISNELPGKNTDVVRQTVNKLHRNGKLRIFERPPRLAFAGSVAARMILADGKPDAEPPVYPAKTTPKKPRAVNQKLVRALTVTPTADKFTRIVRLMEFQLGVVRA